MAPELEAKLETSLTTPPLIFTDHGLRLPVAAKYKSSDSSSGGALIRQSKGKHYWFNPYAHELIGLNPGQLGLSLARSCFPLRDQDALPLTIHLTIAEFDRGPNGADRETTDHHPLNPFAKELADLKKKNDNGWPCGPECSARGQLLTNLVSAYDRLGELYDNLVSSLELRSKAESALRTRLIIELSQLFAAWNDPSKVNVTVSWKEGKIRGTLRRERVIEVQRKEPGSPLFLLTHPDFIQSGWSSFCKPGYTSCMHSPVLPYWLSENTIVLADRVGQGRQAALEYVRDIAYWMTKNSGWTELQARRAKTLGGEFNVDKELKDILADPKFGLREYIWCLLSEYLPYGPPEKKWIEVNPFRDLLSRLPHGSRYREFLSELETERNERVLVRRLHSVTGPNDPQVIDAIRGYYVNRQRRKADQLLGLPQSQFTRAVAAVLFSTGTTSPWETEGHELADRVLKAYQRAVTSR